MNRRVVFYVLIMVATSCRLDGRTTSRHGGFFCYFEGFMSEYHDWVTLWWDYRELAAFCSFCKLRTGCNAPKLDS